jgi:hypothetical protein
MDYALPGVTILGHDQKPIQKRKRKRWEKQCTKFKDKYNTYN